MAEQCSGSSSRQLAKYLCALLAPVAVTFAYAQTFGNLDHYHKANADLLALGTPIKTVIIGDSIVARWPNTRPHFFEETGWIGRGIVSETSAQMLLRFQQDVIDLAPRFVVIIAGTNDIAGNSGEMSENDTLYYLRSMVEIASANGIRPILCKLLPAAAFPWAPGQRPDERIPILNRQIEAYAHEEKVPLVNFFSVMSDGNNAMHSSFSDDGVHPNNLGYAAMESRLKAHIGPLLANAP